MKYYHGTNYDAGLNIIKNGFNHTSTIWNCSDNDMTYLVSEEYDGGPCENDNDEPNNIPAFRFATNAAQIAAANANQLTDKVFIFEFDINDDIELEEDDSCPNMYDCYQIDNDDLNYFISTGAIKVKIYLLNKAYTPYLRIFYLIHLDSTVYDTPDDELKEILTQMKNVEAYWFYDYYLGCFESYQILNDTIHISDETYYEQCG